MRSREHQFDRKNTNKKAKKCLAGIKKEPNFALGKPHFGMLLVNLVRA